MTPEEILVIKVKAALLGKRYIKLSYHRAGHGYYSSSFPADSQTAYTDEWIKGFPSYTLSTVEFMDHL